MASIKYEETTAIKTILNTATQGTTLNGLANAARAISNSTGDIANQTNLDLAVDLELLADWQATPTAGPGAEIYQLTSVDGTNFPDGSTSITPQKILNVATLEIRAIATDQRLLAPGISLSPRVTRWLLINVGGTALGANDGHTLRAQAYRLQG